MAHRQAPVPWERERGQGFGKGLRVRASGIRACQGGRRREGREAWRGQERRPRAAERKREKIVPPGERHTEPPLRRFALPRRPRAAGGHGSGRELANRPSAPSPLSGALPRPRQGVGRSGLARAESADALQAQVGVAVGRNASHHPTRPTKDGLDRRLHALVGAVVRTCAQGGVVRAIRVVEVTHARALGGVDGHVAGGGVARAEVGSVSRRVAVGIAVVSGGVVLTRRVRRAQVPGRGVIGTIGALVCSADIRRRQRQRRQDRQRQGDEGGARPARAGLARHPRASTLNGGGAGGFCSLFRLRVAVGREKGGSGGKGTALGGRSGLSVVVAPETPQRRLPRRTPHHGAHRQREEGKNGGPGRLRRPEAARRVNGGNRGRQLGGFPGGEEHVRIFVPSHVSQNNSAAGKRRPPGTPQSEEGTATRPRTGAGHLRSPQLSRACLTGDLSVVGVLRRLVGLPPDRATGNGSTPPL